MGGSHCGSAVEKICSSCVMLSCHHGGNSLRNVSSEAFLVESAVHHGRCVFFSNHNVYEHYAIKNIIHRSTKNIGICVHI